MADTPRINDFLKHSNLDSKIKSKLKTLISHGMSGKKQSVVPPMPPAGKITYLTPEVAEKIANKELNNFEIVDLTGRAVIVPSSYISNLSPALIDLLRQLSTIYPKALYIRQVTEQEKAGEIKQEFPSTWDYKG